MHTYSPLLNASIGIINDADSPLPFAIYAISIVLGKTLFGIAILKIIQGLWQFFLPKIKRAIAFFKQKIAESEEEGTMWLLMLLGFGVLFLVLGLLLKSSVLAGAFLWGGVIILGGFLLGFVIGSVNGN
jgi:hypothetical protein